MLNIITKIWNLLPALIGAVQVLLAAVKELVMIVIRVIDIFTWSETKATEVINSVNDKYNAVNDWIENIKNSMLGL